MVGESSVARNETKEDIGSSVDSALSLKLTPILTAHTEKLQPKRPIKLVSK